MALAVKQGSQVSDMRHHRFSGRLRNAQVVYFRANTAGACDYFQDSRYRAQTWRYYHATLRCTCKLAGVGLSVTGCAA